MDTYFNRHGDAAGELTSRLNDEREFRFVEVPTAEGQQDAEEGGDTPGGDTPGGDTPGGDTPTPTPDPDNGGGSGDNGGGGSNGGGNDVN